MERDQEQTPATAPAQASAEQSQPQPSTLPPSFAAAPESSINARAMGTSAISLPIQTTMGVNANGVLPFAQQDMGFGLPIQTFPTNAVFPPPDMMMPGNPMSLGLNGSNGPAPMVIQNGGAMSADEIALYDRQIRLWGMQAQKKIQAANILVITVKALTNEIAKNLVLAGIASLTVLDDQLVTEADLGAQFLLTAEDLGQNRAIAASAQLQKLNPRVKVYSDAAGVMTKGASYFSEFDVVIGTDLFPTTLAFINTATRLYNRRFYAAGSHGLYGYAFCDLIEHDYVLKRDKGNVATTVGPETRTRSVTDVKTQKEGDKTIETVAKRELYSTWDLASETSTLPTEYTSSKRRLKAVTPALSCLRALWAFQQVNNRNPSANRQDLEFFTKTATQCHSMLSLPSETLRSEFLRSFLQNIGSEIAPVAAILGGQVAQDIINVLGQSQQPIQNMVIFDGNKMEANMYSLHPEGRLGRAQLELAVNPMMLATSDPQFVHLGHPGSMGQIDPMNPSGGAMMQPGQVDVNAQAGATSAAGTNGQAAA
ncbi:ubiquitin-like 1-activating enzyme E1 A [Microdochium nivale]|nr:ubiquitin-like 1-activating enzyme E1 A [Microdochium nivale]